jgi:uncharacterized membrane protein
MRQYHYLPLTPEFFSILVGLFVILLVLIQLGALRYAYMRLGMSSGAALLLLAASLVGSYFNIPVTQLGGERVISGEVIDYFGMRYVVPVVANWPGTVIAVNVGGALVPVLVSLYLLFRHSIWIRALLATSVVALVIHWSADPVRGVGIAVPVFVPALITAILALVLARERAAPLAYVAGSLGTLIGADLTNLDKVSGLGAPVASIGGAGTFDGIFVTAVIAVLLASIYPWRRRLEPV